MRAWVVRSGARGERDEWALGYGLAGGGFNEFPDLTSAESREQIAAIAQERLAGEPSGKVANHFGQMSALRITLQPGDLIVLPLKTTKQVALGLCTGGYRYLADQPEDRRHAISVDWKRTDVPRSAFKDDLLYTLNGSLSVFQATRNNAVSRLLQVMQQEQGVDLGSAGAPSAPAVPITSGAGPSTEVSDPVTAMTVEAARDRVRTHLAENFAGHKLSQLVAAILETDGFTCEVSPPGPDFGVDIIAGRGPIGLDRPTLVVQVKSENTQVGVPAFNQLKGAVSNHHADQGLLVAWGGITKQAEQLRATQKLSVRVWTAEDILDRLFATYERLPDDVRTAIPLKRVWILVDEPE